MLECERGVTPTDTPRLADTRAGHGKGSDRFQAHRISHWAILATASLPQGYRPAANLRVLEFATPPACGLMRLAGLEPATKRL
jgi:hypothetical protein